ncbi:MAG: ribonuclease H-like domain-containing protein, partial [Spirochaetota bacterium]
MRRLDLYRSGRDGLQGKCGRQGRDVIGGRGGPLPGYEERGRPGWDRPGGGASGRPGGALEELRRLVGGELVGGGAPVLAVRRILPPDTRHGQVRLDELFGFDPSLQQVLFPRAAGTRPGDLLFFDLETTGLSGGAGTHAFLAGFLRAVPGAAPDYVPGAGAAADGSAAGGFELVQYFMPAYASEGLFLELIDRLIGEAGALVSYNGRCFDAGILRTRHVMCGMTAPWESAGEPEQFDLLYPCRRIWRGVLPDHTLGTVERELLGVARERDLPGWMVPQVYTDFLAGRDSGERLAAVFEHNRNDVLSLLSLLVRQLGVVSGSATARRINPVQLSRMLASSRRGEEARRVLSEHREANEALAHLGLLHRR